MTTAQAAAARFKAIQRRAWKARQASKAAALPFPEYTFSLEGVVR